MTLCKNLLLHVYCLADFVVPSCPISVQSLGNAVVWETPSMPSGEIMQYEIQFFIPDTHLRMNSYRNSKGTFYMVKNEDTLGDPQSTYFRVHLYFIGRARYLELLQHGLYHRFVVIHLLVQENGVMLIL